MSILPPLATLLRATLAAALCLALQPAHAASGSLQGAHGYYQSCMQSVTFPRPFGEWDLKGNPKLPQYCECYVPLFTAHNTASRELLTQHGGEPTPEMIKENKATELGIRNSCRKQVGLPAVYDPNINSPYAKDKRAKKRTS
ncbi:hypothetical protein [Massilia sp. TSP1-1-2]|uniref:hypothetical protein n=1 Tax=unclassified Massilia TaxID=2609279 RepID=UPI003CEEB97B